MIDILTTVEDAFASARFGQWGPVLTLPNVAVRFRAKVLQTGEFIRERRPRRDEPIKRGRSGLFLTFCRYFLGAATQQLLHTQSPVSSSHSAQ
jgi:hypothetical protein